MLYLLFTNIWILYAHEIFQHVRRHSIVHFLLKFRVFKYLTIKLSILFDVWTLLFRTFLFPNNCVVSHHFLLFIFRYFVKKRVNILVCLLLNEVMNSTRVTVSFKVNVLQILRLGIFYHSISIYFVSLVSVLFSLLIKSEQTFISILTVGCLT